MRTFLVVNDTTLAVVGHIAASGWVSAAHKIAERTAPAYQADGRLTCWPAESQATIDRAQRLREGM